uniref:ATP-dependent helicase brm n=1 Tax=Ascaris suum TaxID=6253 RepID=F1KQU9_ASCSU
MIQVTVMKRNTEDGDTTNTADPCSRSNIRGGSETLGERIAHSLPAVDAVDEPSHATKAFPQIPLAADQMKEVTETSVLTGCQICETSGGEEPNFGDGERCGNGDIGMPFGFTVMHAHDRHEEATSPHAYSLWIRDPLRMLKEREIRTEARIASRIQTLQNLPADIGDEVRLKAEIQLRSLRLLKFQKQMRAEVLRTLKKETTFETAFLLNTKAFGLSKGLILRDAHHVAEQEKARALECEINKGKARCEFLHTLIWHFKSFKQFHRNNWLKQRNIKDAVKAYHRNSEKERTKELQRKERTRLQRLMQEDEEGYKQLLDEKKDRRLVYLLKQTDEYVESLSNLVRQRATNLQIKHASICKGVAEIQGNDSRSVHVSIREMATDKLLPLEEPSESVSAGEGSKLDGVDKVVPQLGSTVSHVDDDLEGLDEEARNRMIIEKARMEEDEYDQKTKRQSESYYATAHRIKEEVTVQPSTMGGGNPTLQLKPYQLKGVEWMVSLFNNNLNGILADDMGLGKTIQTIALIAYLMEVKKVNGPYLIIVPLSTISNWEFELEKWAPSVVKVVYKGCRKMRRTLGGIILREMFNVLLTTYDYVLKEKALLGRIRWEYIIIDEGHRIRNHDCKLTRTLNGFFNARHRLLLTGTPVQNKLPELWALLNFLLPSIFSSCDTFEQWFNAPFATSGEKIELSEEETMLIIRRLHKVLRPFLLRRLKKEVEGQLPEKAEHLLRCEMSALQKTLYQHMQKGVLIDSNRIGGRLLANTAMQLRKLCNHPFLFQSIEEECRNYWKVPEISGRDLYRVGGKFELLDRILLKLKVTGHRLLMFCQMTSLMSIMEDFLIYRQYRYLRLDGNTKSDDREKLLDLYNAPQSEYFIFLLSTRSGGIGLNLQSADTVVIFDSDWNPHQDKQAESRAHRIGQSREVRVLRLITVNSIEEKIQATAKCKLDIDKKVIQAGRFDQRSTGAERQQILEQIVRGANIDETENEFQDDEMVNQILARSHDEFILFQEMDGERSIRRSSEHRRCRLLTDEEIPASIVEASQKFIREEGDIHLTVEPTAKRQHKAIDYSQDRMSDREWLKVVESIGEKEQKETYETGDVERGQNTRKRKWCDGDDKYTAHKRKKVRPEMTTLLNTLYIKMTNYKAVNGRRVIAALECLDAQDGFNCRSDITGKSMGLNGMKKKIERGSYSSVQEMGDDLRSFCSNVRKCEVIGSDSFKDSVLLEDLWNEMVDEIQQPLVSGTTASDKPSTSLTSTEGVLEKRRKR